MSTGVPDTAGRSVDNDPPLDPGPLIEFARVLRPVLSDRGYDSDGVLGFLGSPAHAALGRGEPAPARRRCDEPASDGLVSRLGTLIRLFMLADDCDFARVERALGAAAAAAGFRAGALDRRGGSVRATLDIRPVDLGAGNRWVVSDIDGSTRRVQIAPDHVLGVGHASVSLLRATPTERVRTVLDLGSGCGVQAVRAADYADAVVATDINPRAAAMTAATAALNGLDIDVRSGAWFEPVAGRTFDRIVANPPFVVGSGDVTHAYRDSGLDLDGASALVVASAPNHLTRGGTATLLAAWLHVRGQDWRTRVSGWLPDVGVDAWFLQRDVADPALYVGTWLRDGGVDHRDLDATQQSNAWLDHLEAADVAAIGFGVVYLRRTDEPTRVVAEDLSHSYSDPLGREAPAHFARMDWLAAHDVMATRCALHPATTLEVRHQPGESGWQPRLTRIHRGDGPQWTHEIDELGAALVAGLRHDGLPVGEVVKLLATAHGLDLDRLTEGSRDLITALIQHGLVVPAPPRGPETTRS